jgi:hypothetical protein
MKTKYDALLAAVKRLVESERKSLIACGRRGALPHGTSRARVTTANANWTNAAEARDVCIEVATREAMSALHLKHETVPMSFAACVDSAVDRVCGGGD